jgi:hypothetical protein
LSWPDTKNEGRGSLKKIASLLLFSLGMCVIISACGRVQNNQGRNGLSVDPAFNALPAGYSVDKSMVASPEETRAISQKLGAAIERLSNTYLTVEGRPIQVNILDAPSDQDAVTLHRAISQMKGDPAFCLRTGRRVIEYVGSGIDVALATKVSYDLGFVTKPNP